MQKYIINGFVFAASAQFGDGRYLANSFHVLMSEFGSFNVVYFFEVTDLARLVFKALEIYVDQVEAAEFFASILGDALVYAVPEGAIEVTWVDDDEGAMRAHLLSEQGSVKEMNILLEAPEPEYEYAEATIPLETFFGRQGCVQDCKEWYTLAVPHGHLRLADYDRPLRPSAGQIKRAEYIYFGPRRAGVHRDTEGKPVVKIVSRML